MRYLFLFLVGANIVSYLFSFLIGLLPRLPLSTLQFTSFEHNYYHIIVGFLATVMTLMIHCVWMIYLILSHKAVKEQLDVMELEAVDFRNRMRAVKMETLPLATLGMIFFISAALAGGGVDTELWPSWIHWSLILGAVGFNLYLFHLEYQYLEKNIQITNEAVDFIIEHREEKEDEEGDETDTEKEDDT